jgi:hypothetical protein
MKPECEQLPLVADCAALINLTTLPKKTDTSNTTIYGNQSKGLYA